jgi:hypothetical protein
VTYFDDFKTMSNATGSDMAEKQLHLLQQSFDKYFLETPDKVTNGKIDSVAVEFVVQNIKYGEQFNDEKLLLVENDTVIDIGSLVEWDGNFWLVMNRENRAIKTHKAFKITLCNNSISWKDSQGNVFVESCYINEGLGAQGYNMSNPLTDGRKTVIVQYNVNTSTIYENQRFILGRKRAYKVTDIDDFTRQDKVISFMFEKDTIDPLDDLLNNIAYNGESTTPQPTPTTEIQFTSSELEIPVGMSESVSVYEYVSGVQQSTTFTFRIDGIDASKYTIVSSTSNTIEIEAKEFYFTGQIVAIKDVTLEETSIPIKLQSLF